MMSEPNRRTMIISVAALGVPLAGCSQDSVPEAVTDAISEIETDTLSEGMVVLRGFEIVAWEVGKRVIFLPVPAVRVIGVSLVVSAGVAKLVIAFLDLELKRREASEPLSSDETVALESTQEVTFKLENGYTEDVPLGQTRYE